MDGFEFRRASSADVDARTCLRQYYAELDHTFPDGFDPDAWGALNTDDTEPPHGCFVVVDRLTDTGLVACGCGAVKTLGPGLAEIKRMWLAADARGLGLGRALLVELEDQARAMGHLVVRLDTSAHLDPAIAMYRSSGYVEIEPYNDNPFAGHWFEKHL